MLKLNVNQEKQLNFEIQIDGVQNEQVSGFLRIEIDSIEYGFPAKVGQESVVVDIPALKSIISKPLKQGTEASVKLEIVADGQYITPWRDTFILSNPLFVEAKIVDKDYNPLSEVKPIIKNKEEVIVKEEKENQVDIEENKNNEFDITDKLISKLAEKLSPVVSEMTSKKKPIKEAGSKKIIKRDITNITEEEVYNYMSRAGTNNPKIQKLIYEQAEVAAKSSKPVDVLRQVVKVLKKK